MTDIKDQKSLFVIEIKSVLLSSKDGMTERELCIDYQQIFCKRLSVSHFGYNKLHDFMVAHPNDFEVRRRANILVYYGVHSTETSDLGRLIVGQKDSKAKDREIKR